jgi:hypothetical protein
MRPPLGRGQRVAGDQPLHLSDLCVEELDRAHPRVDGLALLETATPARPASAGP